MALPVCLERAVVREVEARELIPELLDDGTGAHADDGFQAVPADGDARCALG